MTLWDYHTGWCLLTPLFSVFHSVSPDFEGIVLFFRIFYLLFTVLCAGIISWMMARKRQSPYVWYFVFPFICFVPFSIFQISYNSLTIYLLMLAETILITSEKEKRKEFDIFVWGNSINIKRIIKTAWKSLGNFKELRKTMSVTK